MIRLAYSWVRRVIAVLSLLLLVAAIVAQPTGGGLVLTVLLLLLSFGAAVYPPGIYIWLFTPVCPECGEPVDWKIQQGSQNPYLERLVVRCPRCGKEKVEFSYRPS